MFEMTQIENGPKVVTVPMSNMHSVSAGIWVKTGGRYEPKSINGVSHFIEHLVFKGTKNRNVKEIKEAIEGRGGVLNAFTSEDSTCYFVKMLKEHLTTAIDLVCDLVYNPLFKVSDIEMERTVIMEEIKMYLDLPSHYVHDLLNEVMWPEHPLGRPVLGTFDTIKKMSRQDIVGYVERFYTNKNILLIVCGDVAHDEVVSVAREFIKMNRSGAASVCKKFVRSQKNVMTHFLDKETEQTHFVLGYHAGSRFDPRRFELGLMNIILGANMSSRLFEEVREKRGLAYEIRSHVSLFQDTGSLSISAGVENSNIHKALDVIQRELGKICEKKVAADELRRAKDYFLGQLLLLFESTMDNMLWFGEKIMNFKKEDVPSIDYIRREIEHVSVDDVRAIARDVFTAGNTNFVAIGKLNAASKAKINKVLS